MSYKGLAAVAVAVACTGFAVLEDSSASAETSNPDRVVYSQTGGNPAHYSRIVVRGRGCMEAEDSVTLRIVAVTHHRVVYRCVEH